MLLSYVKKLLPKNCYLDYKIFKSIYYNIILLNGIVILIYLHFLNISNYDSESKRKYINWLI